MTASRRAAIRWTIHFALSFLAPLVAASLPWFALAPVLEVLYPEPPLEALLLVGLGHAVCVYTVIRSTQALRRESAWEGFCAIDEAKARPDDRDEIRSLHAAIEIDRVMERRGLKGRRFVAYSPSMSTGKPGALVFLDCKIDGAVVEARP